MARREKEREKEGEREREGARTFDAFISSSRDRKVLGTRELSKHSNVTSFPLRERTDLVVPLTGKREREISR